MKPKAFELVIDETMNEVQVWNYLTNLSNYTRRSAKVIEENKNMKQYTITNVIVEYMKQVADMIDRLNDSIPF